MNRYGKPLLAALLLALASDALAAERATLARDSELRSKALGDAPVITRLKANTAVTVDSRTGAWAKVTTAERKVGYVRLLNLRTQSAQKGSSGVSALTSAFRTGSSGQSVATGVKGMSAEQLTAAEPSSEQLAQLTNLRQQESQARSGAAAAGLTAQTVAYLPPPVDDENHGKGD
jgi:uncharacterized protein YgiM (DUF1202 family)